MTEEKENILYGKYPKLFAQKDLDARYSAMCWGCQHGDGWFKILDEMCGKLQHLCNKFNHSIEFTTVKEKFGKLRIYYTNEPIERTIDDYSVIHDTVKDQISEDNKKRRLIEYDIFSDVVRCAEIESGCTCEECGNMGEARNDCGWAHQTLCDKCYEQKKDGGEKNG